MAEPSPTSVVAWWGAILSTIVFVWDIIKWKRAGARIRFSIRGGMRTINYPQFDGRTLFAVEASNYGDRATTITNLCFVHFPTLWARIRNRPPGGWVASNPSPAQPLPFELKAGGLWQGMVDQTQEFETMAANGYLMCDLYVSHRTKPIRRRVILLKRIGSDTIVGK